MPRSASKREARSALRTTAPVAAPPASAGVQDATQAGLPVIYSKVSAAEYSITSELGPMTVKDMKSILKWETEKEYQQRMVREKPDSRPEHWLFGETGPRRKDNGQFQPVHCLNTEKQKVVCWANANNRPFDPSWCEDLIHTILRGQWAGPLMFPGETVNGETIRISRHGRVLSGQHQGTALILADELLQKSRAQPGNVVNPKYPAWNGHEHPVLEVIVVTGLSEDERILRTIDYVKPRTAADMLYTMEVFRNKSSVDRKTMTRMLSAAIDLLWTRTDAQGYKTHPEVIGFLERHKSLLKCVEHLFAQNSVVGPDGRNKISRLRISAGHAAALCYLMGSSGPETDGDVYRNESPPSEKGLDWSPWDKAQEFWSKFASDRSFMPVRVALGRLIDSTSANEDNQGLGGLLKERLAIIAAAWEIFKDHPDDSGADNPAFSDQDLCNDGPLCLHYTNLDDNGNILPDGQIKLIEVADFYGIDCPEVINRSRASRSGTPMPPPPTREEIDRAMEEARARRGRQ